MAITVEEMAATVLDTLIPDESFTEDQVIDQFNACVLRVSRRLILPALDTTGTVETVTSAAQVALPTDFQRNLYFCRDESAPQSTVGVFNSQQAMIREFGPAFSTKTGTRVFSVAAVKPFLFYTPNPVAATTLTLKYQRNPAPFDSLMDEFNIFPDGFEDIPYHYACWQLYARIEQGLDGGKVNSNYHRGEYSRMFDELSKSLREGVSMPPPPVVEMGSW